MLVCSLLICSKLHGRLVAPHTTYSLNSKGSSAPRGVGALPTSKTASSSASSTSSSSCGSPCALSRSSSNGWLPVLPSQNPVNNPSSGLQQLQQPRWSHATHRCTSPTLPSTTLPPVSCCIHAWLETAVQQHMGPNVPTSCYSIPDHQQLLAPRANAAADTDQADLESLHADSTGSSNSEAWFISACLSPHRLASLQQQYADGHLAATTSPAVGVAAPTAAVAAASSPTAQDFEHFLSCHAAQPVSNSYAEAPAGHALSVSLSSRPGDAADFADPLGTPADLPQQLPLNGSAACLLEWESGNTADNMSCSSSLSSVFSAGSPTGSDNAMNAQMVPAPGSVGPAGHGSGLAAVYSAPDDTLSMDSMGSISMSDAINIVDLFGVHETAASAAEVGQVAASVGMSRHSSSSSSLASNIDFTENALVQDSLPITTAAHQHQEGTTLNDEAAGQLGAQQGAADVPQKESSNGSSTCAASAADVVGSSSEDVQTASVLLAEAGAAPPSARTDVAVMTRIGSADSDWSLLSQGSQ